MLDVAVNAAVRQQSHDMERRPLRLAVVHCGNIGLVCEKVPVLNGLGDPGQVLKDHPARADIGVSHLGIAHLPCGQPHIQAGRGQLTAGIGGKDAVQVWLFRVGNGVARGLLPESKPVHDDESGRRFVHDGTSNL